MPLKLALTLVIISLPVASQNFVDGEVPTGKINGINTKFTLAYTPNPVTSIAVYRNGIRQRKCPACNYTVNAASAIIFNACCIPQPGDVILVDYRWEDPGPGRLYFGGGPAPTSTVYATDGMTYSGVLYIDSDGKLKVLLLDGTIVVVTP